MKMYPKKIDLSIPVEIKIWRKRKEKKRSEKTCKKMKVKSKEFGWFDVTQAPLIDKYELIVSMCTFYKKVWIFYMGCFLKVFII